MPAFEHALVVGKFAPLHRGHQLVLDTAQQLARHTIVIVWSNPDFSTMPNAVRAEWLADLYPDAMVLVGHNGPRNDAPDADQHAYIAHLLAERGIQPDVVLTSEAYGRRFAASLGAAHHEVDAARTEVPISGEAIRSDIHEQRQWLDPRVYQHFVERVVFQGAEGTGKSTLTEHMAREMGTAFVPEYGRDHYAERDGHLDLDDYVTIARRHRALEDETMLRASRYVFVDTNAITTMFFSHYYNRDSRPALRALADDCGSRYQHVIVCDDDIPFEQDGWRDNETWRARMQGMVLHDLAVRGIAATVVRGTLEQRARQVRAALALGPLPSTDDARISLGPRPGAPR